MSQNYTTQPTDAEPQDYYEVLQVSPTAELETIHRVYRLLAQRFSWGRTAEKLAERFGSLVASHERVHMGLRHE